MIENNRIDENSSRNIKTEKDDISVNEETNTAQKTTEKEADEKQAVSPLIQGIIWVVLLGFLAFIGSGLLRAQK
ncbi:MAG: hypothetical protein MUO76_18810, partial [Anaerolineaceae bacterium]|nr:hypothetical protein [Anaerolineaceae bacterium]